MWDYNTNTKLGADISLTNITGNTYYAYLDIVTLEDAKALATDNIIQARIQADDGTNQWDVARTEPIFIQDPNTFSDEETILINYENATLFDSIPYAEQVSSEAFSSVDDMNGFAVIVGGGSKDTSLVDRDWETNSVAFS